MAKAPAFQFDSPPASLLAALVHYYEAVTSDPVRTLPKRNLLAACYRVHGDDVTSFITDEFARLATAANLLGIIRTSPPRERGSAGEKSEEGRRSQGTASAGHNGPPCPVDECLSDLIYCENHRPPFDPSSSLRYDRHPSNPAAAMYFAKTDG